MYTENRATFEYLTRSANVFIEGYEILYSRLPEEGPVFFLGIP